MRESRGLSTPVMGPYELGVTNALWLYPWMGSDQKTGWRKSKALRYSVWCPDPIECNVAFWTDKSPKWQPSSLQNLGLATAKHHATEGRPCLTSFSEPWRLAKGPLRQTAYPSSQNGPRRPDGACGLQLAFPGFLSPGFLNLQLASCPSSLPRSPCCRQGSADILRW